MSDTPKTTLLVYRYDGLDRLVFLNRSAVNVQRFYDEGHLTTEIQGDEQVSFIHYGDKLLAQRQKQSQNVINWLLTTDLQGSVLNTLEACSQQNIAYSPYGHRTSESGLSSLLGFNGQRREPVTGHYVLGNGYRAFNPVLMRFNSPDNMSPFGKGGFNSYSYCQGEPINRIDSEGHFFKVITSAFSRMRTGYLSFARGNQSKRITHLTRISEEMAIFVDKYKGGARLNIYGHGASESGVQSEKGVFLGPKSLAEKIKATGLHFESFDSVRLLACHSASEFKHPLNPSGAAYGQLFSDFAGRPVKAFNGRVMPKNLDPRLKKLKIGQTSARSERFHINKRVESQRSRFLDASYDPVTFQPSRVNSDIRGE